jgi:hypothetical protein
MSFDLYLLPLQATDDFQSAMSVLDTLDRVGIEPQPGLDVRHAADVIMQLDPRYRSIRMNFAEIAKYERISEEEARTKYVWIELNGTANSGEPMAQFVFHPRHAVIHWYAGTTPDELDRYVIAICAATGLAAVDPQEETVQWLQEDGTLL